tara:strand:+ start:1537 stop:1722 length:186 start_codon:yes stop_codon:yes gene_type:complete
MLIHQTTINDEVKDLQRNKTIDYLINYLWEKDYITTLKLINFALEEMATDSIKDREVNDDR